MGALGWVYGVGRMASAYSRPRPGGDSNWNCQNPKPAPPGASARGCLNSVVDVSDNHGIQARGAPLHLCLHAHARARFSPAFDLRTPRPAFFRSQGGLWTVVAKPTAAPHPAAVTPPSPKRGHWPGRRTAAGFPAAAAAFTQAGRMRRAVT